MNAADSVPIGFPSTSWSDVREAGARSREALERLARRYWMPVYWWVRLEARKEPESAMDITQSFFAHLVESGFAAKADAARGRFRAFLKSSLRNFLADEARRTSSLKRGGEALRISIEDAESRGAELLAAGRELGPEQVFEREWCAAVVRSAVAETERQLVAEGKARYWDVFRRHDLEPAGGYRGVADALGLSEDDVRNYLRVARQVFRDCVRAEVRETVGSLSDLDGEFSELFSWLK